MSVAFFVFCDPSLEDVSTYEGEIALSLKDTL